MIRIIVDANIILSALLGGGARFVLFSRRFEFVTTEFTLDEVKRYLPLVETKSGVPVGELQKMISLLPIIVYPKTHYRRALTRAKKAITHIDPHDADSLALYFIEHAYLWSEDRDFEKIKPPIRILKTKDFF